MFGGLMLSNFSVFKNDLAEYNLSDDFNIYDKQVENIYSKTYKIDAFIEQTILILNN